MKCSKCKKAIEEGYTSKDNKIICEKCLEKEIYKQRKKIIKKYKGSDKE